MKFRFVKMLTAILAILLTTVVPGQAEEENPSYFTLSAGYVMLNDSDVNASSWPGGNVEFEYESGYGGSAALGYDFGHLRLEWEVAYQTNDFDKIKLYGIKTGLDGDLSITSLLLNGYWDFLKIDQFTPFIGAGIGYSKLDISGMKLSGTGGSGYNDDCTSLTWQIGAGVSFALAQNMALELRYRYFVVDDPKFTNLEIDASSHQGWFGFRFMF